MAGRDDRHVTTDGRGDSDTRGQGQPGKEAADNLKSALDNMDRRRLQRAAQSGDDEAVAQALEDLASRGTIEKDEHGIWRVPE